MQTLKDQRGIALTYADFKGSADIVRSGSVTFGEP
jgi:hypothetical protein